MRNYYLLLEVLPVLTWGYAYYLEKRYSNYPDFSRGYPNRRIRRTRQAWDLGNQIMAKSIKTAATMMILINVMFFFLDIVNYGFATGLNVFIILVGILSGEQKLRQQIDEKGQVIKVLAKQKHKMSLKK